MKDYSTLVNQTIISIETEAKPYRGDDYHEKVVLTLDDGRTIILKGSPVEMVVI